MSSWVYILKLSNGKYYIDSTRNLKQRIYDHQNGKSGFTSKYLPIKLKYSQKFDNHSDALKTEKYLKSLKNQKIIKSIITSQTIKFYK